MLYQVHLAMSGIRTHTNKTNKTTTTKTKTKATTTKRGGTQGLAKGK
jgi:hypothetical protein